MIDIGHRLRDFLISQEAHAQNPIELFAYVRDGFTRWRLKLGGLMCDYGSIDECLIELAMRLAEDRSVQK